MSKKTVVSGVIGRIAHLPDTPFEEIKSLWQQIFATPMPTHNRQFLERRIAYRLQEIEFRKIDRNLMDRNDRRIKTIIETGQNKKRDRDHRPVAGTLLTREYKGVIHKVVATPDGQYDFQGRMYPSLSMIAREITGTRWSGPLFFGLKPSATKPTSKKGGCR
ncbi:hypothetical protein FERRO_15920 [Ferrovum sp. JA12]|uniref:DUF2924 domain-containing protein n=1 Tax=Ferrovum sp. JA12 TaxID=1356299 RepID=UPI00070248E2|nr:DUF2924 domain-containing protein [Ferrovum sp. JA12]KRH78601.1 hypothetical protein FERRO_15920 [Ferrovum sp. JA12]